jgi:hypothetical protein
LEQGEGNGPDRLPGWARRTESSRAARFFVGYAAVVVHAPKFGRIVRHAALAALLLAGCRDVLGVKGYSTGLPNEAGSREAGVQPHEAGVVPPDANEAGMAPPHTADARAQPLVYDSPYGTKYADERCGMCMDAHCGAEAEACSNDRTCVDLSNCLAGCGGPGSDLCWVSCNQSKRRTTPMSELMACAAHHCPDYCAAAHATYGSLACTRCLEINGSGLLKELSRSAAALDLDACQQDCPPPYRDRCECSDIYRFGKHSSGMDAALQSSIDTNLDSGGSRPVDSLRDGAWDGGDGEDILGRIAKLANDQSCYSSCVNDQDWSCLDAMPKKEPPDYRTELELNLRLIDVASVEPLPVVGVNVRACQAVDPDCKEGQQEPPTDDAGFTKLRFARKTAGPAASPFFGYLEVTWDPGNDPSSTLLYFFPTFFARSPAWTLRRLVSHEIANANVRNVLGREPRWDQKGGVVFSVSTCNGLPAVGLTAALDTPRADEESDLVFYSNDQWALSRTTPSTTSSALGAFVDVTQGQRTLTLYRDQAKTQPLDSYSFNVRVGTITTVALAPYLDPRP